MSAKGRGKCIERHLPGLSGQMFFDAFDERSDPGKRSFTGNCPSDVQNNHLTAKRPRKTEFYGELPVRCAEQSFGGEATPENEVLRGTARTKTNR